MHYTTLNLSLSYHPCSLDPQPIVPLWEAIFSYRPPLHGSFSPGSCCLGCCCCFIMLAIIFLAKPFPWECSVCMALEWNPPFWHTTAMNYLHWDTVRGKWSIQYGKQFLKTGTFGHWYLCPLGVGVHKPMEIVPASLSFSSLFLIVIGVGITAVSDELQSWSYVLIYSLTWSTSLGHHTISLSYLMALSTSSWPSCASAIISNLRQD